MFTHIISSYTRSQAINDGLLIDVSAMAREAGIRFPVALTNGVWASYVELTPAARRAGNDEQGRIWDILWMLRNTIRRSAGTEAFFQVLVVTDRLRPSMVTLKVTCGPGDHEEPVITVLLPNED